SLVLKVHTRSAGRPGDQRYRAIRPRRVLLSNIDRDEDLASTPMRSPEIEGVVSADRLWQMIAPTELHERPSLAIIFGKDAGHPLLIRWQAVIHLSNQRDLFLPTKAIGQGLWQAVDIAGLLLRPCTTTLAVNMSIHGGGQHRHRCGGQ